MLGPLVLTLLTQGPVLHTVQLENGMTWLLYPRSTDARIAGVVLVRAGSVDDVEGATGAAHFLEHLAFKGTPLVGPLDGWRSEGPALARVLASVDALAQARRRGAEAAELARLEQQCTTDEQEWAGRADASRYETVLRYFDFRFNAYTSADTTQYVATFPQQQLRLWLQLEAQRFAAPVWREFRVEQSVVLQELKDRRTTDSPALEALRAAAFAGTGYAWGVGGSQTDVALLGPSAVDQFYVRHYAPGNAFGVLVGPFEPELARRWLHDTFGQLPARSFEPRAEVQLHPARRLAARCTEPWLLVATPVGPSRVLESAATTLAFELTLRAFRRAEPELRVDRQQEGNEQPHLLVAAIPIPSGKSAAALEQAWFDARRSVRVTERDLAKHELKRQRALAFTFDDASSLAGHFASRWSLDGDCHACFDVRSEVSSLEAVQRALDAMVPETTWVVECRP